MLAPWISRVLAPLVQRRLPRGTTPNHVTVFGSLLCWLALGGLLLAPADSRPGLGAVVAALLGSYCVLDHVDGLHARLTARSSAWGEYLDHALDAWNVALVIGTLGALQPGGWRPEVMALTLAVAGLATAGVWLEQHERGALFLGPIGPVEALLLVGLFLLSWGLPGAVDFWRQPLGVAGLSRVDGVLLGGAIGAAACLAAAGRAAPGARGVLALLALEFVVSGVMGARGWVPWSVVWTVIGMGAAIYSGRIISAYLQRAPRPWPDGIGPLGLGVIAVAVGTSGVAAGWFWLVPAALVVRAGWCLSAARRALRVTAA